MSPLISIETVRRDERVTRNGRYLYVFGFLPQWCRGLTRDMFFKALCAEGIPAGSGFPALYTQALFDTGPVRRITGNRSYNGIQHPVCERVVREKGMWIAHQALLGSEGDTRDITKAMRRYTIMQMK